jgi:hypothetical protein
MRRDRFHVQSQPLPAAAAVCLKNLKPWSCKAELLEHGQATRIKTMKAAAPPPPPPSARLPSESRFVVLGNSRVGLSESEQPAAAAAAAAAVATEAAAATGRGGDAMMTAESVCPAPQPVLDRIRSRGRLTPAGFFAAPRIGEACGGRPARASLIHTPVRIRRAVPAARIQALTTSLRVGPSLPAGG